MEKNDKVGTTVSFLKTLLIELEIRRFKDQSSIFINPTFHQLQHGIA